MSGRPAALLACCLLDCLLACVLAFLHAGPLLAGLRAWLLCSALLLCCWLPRTRCLRSRPGAAGRQAAWLRRGVPPPPALPARFYLGTWNMEGFMAEGRQVRTLGEILDRLRETYCSSIGYEVGGGGGG